MSDKRIPMVAEVLPIEQPPLQSSFGTGVPKKIKKARTGLIVFLSLLCVILATALGVLGLKDLRIDLQDGRLRFLSEQEQPQTPQGDRKLQPNEDAQQPTENDMPISGKTQIGWQMPQKETLTVQQIYQTVSPGVVCLLSDGGTVCGTGFVIGEDGLLLTTTDFADGSGKTQVLCADGTEGTAKLIGYDRTTGVALLLSDLDLEPLCFGDTDTLQVGDTVYCIGNLHGKNMRNTLSEGMLTGIGSDSVCGQQLTILSSDAVFGPSHTGCPLFDSAGNVIGVTSSIGTMLTGTGGDPCFAIGAEDVQRIAKTLLTDAETQKNRWLGFEAEEIPQTYLYYFGFPGSLWISEVGYNTYAYGALEAYDVILSVNGTSVNTPEEYEEVLASYEIGDILELRIFRDGIFYKIDLPLTAK